MFRRSKRAAHILKCGRALARESWQKEAVGRHASNWEQASHSIVHPQIGPQREEQVPKARSEGSHTAWKSMQHAYAKTKISHLSDGGPTHLVRGTRCKLKRSQGKESRKIVQVSFEEHEGYV